MQSLLVAFTHMRRPDEPECTTFPRSFCTRKGNSSGIKNLGLNDFDMLCVSQDYIVSPRFSINRLFPESFLGE